MKGNFPVSPPDSTLGVTLIPTCGINGIGRMGHGELMGPERSFAGRVKETAVALEGIPMVLLCLQCVLLQQGGFPGLWLLALCSEGAQYEDITTITHSAHVPASLEQTAWPWEGWGQHLLLRRDPRVVNPRTLSTHHRSWHSPPNSPLCTQHLAPQTPLPTTHIPHLTPRTHYPAAGTLHRASDTSHPAFSTPHPALST